VPWREWVRTVEVEACVRGGDGERQLEGLLRAACRVFHFHVGDGRAARPDEVAPAVVADLGPLIHHYGGVVDVHLAVADPEAHFGRLAEAGADHVTFDAAAVGDVAAVVAAARQIGLQVGIAVPVDVDLARAAQFAGDADVVLIEDGTGVGSDRLLRVVQQLRRVLPATTHVQVETDIRSEDARALHEAGATLLVTRNAIFDREDLPRAYRRLVRALVDEAALSAAVRRVDKQPEPTRLLSLP
jgi:ribulose-phosphate 3-epimerase